MTSQETKYLFKILKPTKIIFKWLLFLLPKRLRYEEDFFILFFKIKTH